MPYQLTYKVINLRGPITQVRARLEIAGDMSKVLRTRNDIIQFVSPFQFEDGVRFRKASARGFGGKRLSIASVIWTRDRSPSGAPFRTMKQVIGASAAAFPLRDTNFLHDGVAGPQSAFAFANASFIRFRRRPGGATITFGPEAPYAAKHIQGGGALFSFNREAQRKLKERVPPPNKSFNAKLVGRAKSKGLRGKKLRNLQQTELRPYYVLLGIARKFYGTGEAKKEKGIVAGGFKRGRVPKRNWIRPYSRITREIAQLFLEKKINEDLRRASLERARGFRLERIRIARGR